MDGLYYRMNASSGILTDEDIAIELERFRARNTAAEIATQNVRAKTRRENEQCKRSIKRMHVERLKKEVENSLAHLKRFGGMYDNSPYRHDVVAMRGKQKAKRRSEEKLQANIDKVHAKLAAMNGIDEEFVSRKVESKILHQTVNTVEKELVLDQRLAEVDSAKINSELEYLDEMVATGLRDTQKVFPRLALPS